MFFYQELAGSRFYTASVVSGHSSGYVHHHDLDQRAIDNARPKEAAEAIYIQRVRDRWSPPRMGACQRASMDHRRSEGLVRLGPACPGRAPRTDNRISLRPGNLLPAASKAVGGDCRDRDARGNGPRLEPRIERAWLLLYGDHSTGAWATTRWEPAVG